MTKKQQTTAHFSFGLGQWPRSAIEAGDAGRGRMFEGGGVSGRFRLDNIYTNLSRNKSLSHKKKVRLAYEPVE